MTLADALSETMAASYTGGRTWSGQEFQRFLDDPKTVFVGDENAFVLARNLGPEAEVLMLATHPRFQRQGRGLLHLQSLLEELGKRAVELLFLEVRADNLAAIGLYQRVGFLETARRKGYYANEDGTREDALILQKTISDLG